MNIRDICTFILRNINEDISIDMIADTFHYDKAYLMRKFKEFTGFTITSFINECRVYNSTDPLIYTDDSILKIALNNGFNSLEYYSEKFKDIIGSSPLRFRQIYSNLLNIINNSNDPKELKSIKSAFEELEEYQYYLKNVGNREISKPKVKVLK